MTLLGVVVWVAVGAAVWFALAWLVYWLLHATGRLDALAAAVEATDADPGADREAD